MKTNKKIVLLRERMGFTQQEVANQIGVTRGNVSRWEVGTHIPRGATLQKISEFFGVPIDYLIDEKQTSPPPLTTRDKKVEEKILDYVRHIGYAKAWALLTALDFPEEEGGR